MSPETMIGPDPLKKKKNYHKGSILNTGENSGRVELMVYCC